MARSTSSATRWPLITKSDTVDIATGIPVAIQCGTTAGTVVAVDAEGNEMPCVLQAGQQLGIQPKRIKSTGSDAINVYALYNN